jgi:predicted dehydrogenase
MSTRGRTTRRQFLQRAAAMAGTALLPGSALSAAARTAASDRITLGFIGVGNMGAGHLRGLLHDRNVQVLAVCDVDAGKRRNAKARVEGHYGQQRTSGRYKGCAAYNEFERLLAREDIDAVVISTPDHWHAIIAVAAANAGKDVFCEKPLSLTIREARAMVTAARRYGCVFQTGSQQRSSGNFRRACELVRNGRIGRIREVYVNVGGPSRDLYLPAQPMPEGLDWDRWLGPAPWQPYNRERCSGTYGGGWRRIRDYSGGMMTDWGAHHFDIAQWALGMDGSGPVEITPPDGRAVRRLTFRYANGVRMYRGGGPKRGSVQFVGTDGVVGVGRGFLASWPARIIAEPIGPTDVHLYRSRGHRADWLECIRTRRRPICDVEVGCRSVTVCHLGNIAWWLGRPIRWDPAAERIPGDAQAARWLDRPMRAPWRL